MFRGITANWMPVFAIVVAVIFVAEWTVRFLAPQPLLNKLTVHDPVLGGRGAPNGHAVVAPADRPAFRIDLNASGMRVDEEVSRSTARRRVLVFGGSATFAAHLPYGQTYFAHLKERSELVDRRIQLLNAAFDRHGIWQSRLLMAEQIPRFKPTAMIYFFDAEAFARALVAGDGPRVGQLVYTPDGRPKLDESTPPVPLEYLEALYRGLDWLQRHAHLAALGREVFRQAAARLDEALKGAAAEVRLSELPRFAAESADVQERHFIFELHFQKMMRMSSAAGVPLLIVWVPARQELNPGRDRSSVADILRHQRQLISQLASGFPRTAFWDTVSALQSRGGLPNPATLYEALTNSNSRHLNAPGALWFADAVSPAIIDFLEAVFAGRF